ncbi:hypothetical protein QE422_000012 [Chryseobacterium sp. SORGH_AS 447]|uniref:hypothetical protein n=1 Tax=Chryseobacterium sp. SORGH_AS_0447 TaxID=3041769 RepID=UPI00278AD19E|nr:hypothetical protein [Chryseobacterium sp. SORGH_AS_0447]MDQ1159644.1 hypothetical protein [Chryseobacterium sp. SORGH_AS_0447]
MIPTIVTNFSISLIIVIFYYFFDYKKDNYSYFIKRLKKRVSFDNSFRIFKYTFLIFLGYHIFNHLLFIKTFNEYKYSKTLYIYLIENILDIYIFSSILILLIYLIFKERISDNLCKDFENSYGRKFTFFIKYYILYAISFVLFALSLALSNWILETTDILFIKSGFYPLKINYNSSNYYQSGVYLSTILSFLTTFIFFNSIIKHLNSRYTPFELVNFFLICVIVAIGTFSGFYSLLNFVINIYYLGYDGEWINQDKLVGYYSIRITSIILLFSLLTFIYKTIFHGNIIYALILGLLPLENKLYDTRNIASLYGLDSDYYDKIYFLQLGFYILSIFISQFLISNNSIDFYSSIIFLVSPIIVDDFLVIHVYHKKFGYIDKLHNAKINGFNIILFISSITTLHIEKKSLLLIFYIIFSIIFLIIFVNDFRKNLLIKQ